MVQYSDFFLSNQDNSPLYQKAFFSLITEYAKNRIAGYFSEEAWNKAWQWAVVGIGLNDKEVDQVRDLLVAFSCNKKMSVSLFWKKEKHNVVVGWWEENTYPHIL